MTADPISPDLKAVLRRLKLGRMLDTLPERLTLARQQKMPHQDFLLLVLSDEASRRDSQGATLRAQRAHLDPTLLIPANPNTRSDPFRTPVPGKANALGAKRRVDGGWLGGSVTSWGLVR